MMLTIASLLSEYRAGTLDPWQMFDYTEARSAEFTEHNIWIHKLSRSEISPFIDRLENESPDSLPLYGIPFAIKDNIDLAGIPTTAACPDYTDIPDETAFVVQQLINAGAIPLGKTNMDQFATGLVGTRSPEPWGACRNAFNPDYISGGSSSGSAVAVSLGLVSFSLGTDTAGSGRVPAALNHIVGVKPSRGLLSAAGVVPACRTLDCVSIFALNTDDANRVMAVASAYDEQDDYARANPYCNTPGHYGAHNGEFVFGVPRKEQCEFFGNDSAERLFADSVQRLMAMGGQAMEMDFSPFFEAARLLYDGPWVAERYTVVEDLLEKNPDSLLPVIAEIISPAKNMGAVRAFKAEYQLQHYRKLSQQMLEKVDFVLTPTIATPYRIDEVELEPLKLNSRLGYYTNFMNLLDCSAVAVPAGFLANGIPWGVTFFSSAFKDTYLLSVAKRWLLDTGFSLGKIGYEFQPEEGFYQACEAGIPLIVCGAHLRGLPLNWQLTERGAHWLEATFTSSDYRLYALDGEQPKRPGLVRDEAQGAAIAIEIWSVPRENFGDFVAQIPAPLGIGKVETQDGRWLPGFICENHGLGYAKDITQLGGWREYIKTLAE